MVKLDQFDIVFDNAEQAYFAGQEISGKIIIAISDEKKVNEILLEIKGRAKTYWTKHSGKSRQHCSCSEPYFCEQFNTLYTHKFDQPTSANDSNGVIKDENNKTNIIEENNAADAVNKENLKNISIKKDRKLPSGTHEIPFSYTLPKTLPSSFEGEFGFVRYTCRAICERPWDFDICTRRAFSVVGIEDINEDAEVIQPKAGTATFHHQHLWCINQGDIIMELQMPRSGYTPGEAILVNGKIENKSRKVIRSSSLKLIQHVCYRAKTFSGAELEKNTSRLVTKLDKGEICVNSKFLWENEVLLVPAIPPMLSKCKIIQIGYTIELETSTGAKVALPIVIGTIPLISEILKKNCSLSNKFNTAIENGVKATNDENSTKIENNSITTSMNAEDSTIVQVTITDESGRTAAVLTKKNNSTSSDLTPQENETTTALSLNEETQALINGKKRVRMPSTILSELYPTLPSPYYKESCFGRICISDEKERNQFGNNLFAPKYPFYIDDE